MNDSVILELLRRVQTLESKVEHLEYQLVNSEEQQPDEEENKVTRSVARQYVMDNIQKQYPFLDIVKGNRSIRVDLILTNQDTAKGNTVNTKFYYSKSYLDYPGGWHTVKSSDLNNDNLDLHIFTVSDGNDYHTFLFSHEHLKNYVKTKKMDSSDQYYFYFQIENEKIVERRDDEKDVSSNYENWDLIGEILNNKKK